MKVVWISDLDARGSGYKNLSCPLCAGLSEMGHEVKCIGLGYDGSEHPFPFTILPAKNIQEVLAIVQNIYNLWQFDVLVVALDIPLHERILVSMQTRPFPYLGILPIEADPLCFSWAAILMQMDKVFVISQFGADEAEKIGIDAEHIRIGIDIDAWVMPTEEEKNKLREILGFTKDTFVVLTVADNQERKNLSGGMEIFADFAEDKEDVRYVLVTREHNYVGWKLRDYAQRLGISAELMIFERGLSHKELWSVYASSDVFLLPSKAEGLGLPLLEAMAVGVPVIGTNCTAIQELINAGDGFLLDYDYTHVDPFGNGLRYWASRKHGVELLNEVRRLKGRLGSVITNAREFVEGRKWSIAVEQLDKAIKAIKRNDND